MNSIFDDMVSEIVEESVVVMTYLERGGPKDYGEYKGAVGEMLAFTKSVEIIKAMKRKLEED